MSLRTTEDVSFRKRITSIARDIMMGIDVSHHARLDVAAARLWLRLTMRVPRT